MGALQKQVVLRACAGMGGSLLVAVACSWLPVPELYRFLLAGALGAIAAILPLMALLQRVQGEAHADAQAEHPLLQALMPSIFRKARTGEALEQTLVEGADANAVSAAQVSYAADRLRSRLDRQVENTNHMTDYAGRIMETIRQSAEQASEAASAASQASEVSDQGQTALREAIEQVRRVHEQSSETVSLIQALNDKSETIQNVTSVIEGIAEQTNLLALNAAIEAARAGEQGRGFAVVADEVRQLAGRTSEATKEASSTLESIQQDTGHIVTRVKELATSVENGLDSVEAVGHQLDEINTGSRKVEEQVRWIAEGDQHNEESLGQMFGSIESLRDEMRDSDEAVAELAQQASRLMELAEQTNAEFALYSSESYHRRFYEAARTGAAEIARCFEQALERGELTREQLFSKERTPIPGTDPQKYHSPFDAFTDRHLPAIQEPVVESLEPIVFAITAAPDGYVPTHNNVFAHEPTGDPQVDLVKSRSKRLFNDRTGARCGSHTRDMLLQTYRRDTGEIMHDLSVPIYVNGTHWGGFRLGYRPAQH
ncbi:MULTISPECIES: methyl-accepting chemotaxis protein [Gammaproteobacteria]|uniref:Methyl-accepting chemotaxis protein n=1 Tax=Vreelandella halophila TaxID=86177 RepID=A0A9X5B579_9GAMM|nr:MULTISPECIES: methyl-accepting chemotaxis protein [Gammaproteobacteria]KAA8983376.1 methyl-accepting chemotaxis protein [Halospina sp. K52047b]MYL27085.1 methyl-accepting chemotaxis protein [Halomonas utahensis]MYL74287.1 methyl-accepting chemotaxis protein [Halomonas sp. 22501_18_FS]